MNLNRRVPNGLPGGVRGRKFYYFLLLDFVDSIKQQSPNGRYVKFFVKKYVNIKHIPEKINNI